MKTCTADFLAAAIATVRKPKARIDITWTDAVIDESIVVTATGDNRASVKEHVADGNSTGPYKYALLEDAFKLDGTFHPFPGTDAEKLIYQVGWYNDVASDGDGLFSEPYPTLQVEFDPRPIFAIYVVGDTATGQYPIDFDVHIYNAIGGLAQSISVTDNDSVQFIYNLISAITSSKIVLIIHEWSAANTVCKIVEFYTSVHRSYEGDEIVSLNILEEREIHSGGLPVGSISANELDIELNNVKITDNGNDIIDPFFPGNSYSFLSYLTKPNRKIVVYLGFELPSETIEYMTMGTFWTKDWSIDDRSFSCSTTCWDRIGILRKSYFNSSSLYENENTNLYALAEAVLYAARDYIPMPDLTWDIDTDLNNYAVPFAWFEDQTSYADALRIIAEACVGQVYMNSSDVLIIESYKANIPLTVVPDLRITKDNLYSKKQPSKIDQLYNSIKVETQPMAVDADASQVYYSDEIIAIGGSATLSMTIKYYESPVSSGTETVTFEDTSGIDLQLFDATYYAWGADLVIKNLDSYSGTFHVAVSAKVVRVNGTEIITSENPDSINSYGRLEYKFPKNILVQTRTIAEQIADIIKDSYSIERKDAEIEWRGNPALELGDTIEVSEYQRGTINNVANFIVYKNELSFDGALSGRTCARKVTEYNASVVVYQDTDGAVTEYQDTDGATTQWQDGD